LPRTPQRVVSQLRSPLSSVKHSKTKPAPPPRSVSNARLLSKLLSDDRVTEISKILLQSVHDVEKEQLSKAPRNEFSLLKRKVPESFPESPKKKPRKEEEPLTMESLKRLATISSEATLQKDKVSYSFLCSALFLFVSFFFFFPSESFRNKMTIKVPLQSQLKKLANRANRLPKMRIFIFCKKKRSLWNLHHACKLSILNSLPFKTIVKGSSQVLLLSLSWRIFLRIKNHPVYLCVVLCHVVFSFFFFFFLFCFSLLASSNKIEVGNRTRKNK